jgi:uncharacterized protein (DUF305 family)
MPKISLYLAAGLLVVAEVMGIMVGYYLTPQYTAAMYEKNMDLGTADRLVDLRYINAMAAHHRGAILLAEQVGQSHREELRNLAADIQVNEPKLIAELYSWKKDWYGDVRTVRDPVVARIGATDNKAIDQKFDLRFLNALIAHHEAGIEMTQEIKTKSSRAEVLNNADAVEQFLTGSLVTLKEWRKNWYNI